MSKRYSQQLEAAIASGKSSYKVFSPKDLKTKMGSRSKKGTPKKILTKVKNAMKSPTALYINLQGMRKMERFREALKGLSQRKIENITTKMNKAPFDMPIRVEYSQSGTFTGQNVILTDGRHRLQAAREFGAKRILARVVVRDEEGDILSDTIELLPTGGNLFRVEKTKHGQELKPN